jgi:hypothetical protein
VAAFEQKVNDLLVQADGYRELPGNLADDDV